MLRWLAAIAIVLAASGCGRSASRRTSELTVEEVYSSEDDDAIGVIGDDLLVRDGALVRRLDLDPLGVTWEVPVRGQVFPPDTADGDVLVLMRGEGAVGAFDRRREPASVFRIDGATGKVRARSVLDRSFKRALRHGDSLYAIGDHTVSRHDDRQVWSVEQRGDDGGWFTHDAVWVQCNHRVCGYALDDGRALGTLDSWPGRAAADPDGDVIAIADGQELVVYDATTRRVRWRVAGAHADVVASARWIAATSKSSDGDRITVWNASDGTPAWSHRGQPGTYLAYLALGDDLLAYYSSATATVRAVRIRDGASVLVVTLGSGVVYSPDVVGVAPPVPARAPEIHGRLVFVHQWGVRVFRISDP